MRKLICLLLLGGAVPAQAAAPSYAHVEALQPPAWVLRGDARTALAPGMPLYAGERYLTGEHARVHFALDDGSVVKLGEQAEFSLPRLSLKKGQDQTAVLQGALQLLKGAFRFTTSVLGHLKRRELDIAVGPTITAGIRGTDIWGESDSEQELLCLIEGKLDVRSPGQSAVTMDQPKTFYVVPRGQGPQPVVATPPEKLEGWIPQTELIGQEVSLHARARWSLVLAQYLEVARARERVAQLDAAGYPVSIVQRPSKDIVLQALVTEGFRSRDDAQRYAAELQQKFDFVQKPQVLAPAN
ncbi:MAG TPA: FecR domain-containing protein [Nevskiaceae bacterium]|nr:FecR domain-containing protein [Nevskiaceae bacterium]